MIAEKTLTRNFVLQGRAMGVASVIGKEDSARAMSLCCVSSGALLPASTGRLLRLPSPFVLAVLSLAGGAATAKIECDRDARAARTDLLHS